MKILPNFKTICRPCYRSPESCTNELPRSMFTIRTCYDITSKFISVSVLVSLSLSLSLFVPSMLLPLLIQCSTLLPHPCLTLPPSLSLLIVVISICVWTVVMSGQCFSQDLPGWNLSPDVSGRCFSRDAAR